MKKFGDATPIKNSVMNSIYKKASTFVRDSDVLVLAGPNTVSCTNRAFDNIATDSTNMVHIAENDPCEVYAMANRLRHSTEISEDRLNRTRLHLNDVHHVQNTTRFQDIDLMGSWKTTFTPLKRRLYYQNRAFKNRPKCFMFAVCLRSGVNIGGKAYTVECIEKLLDVVGIKLVYIDSTGSCPFYNMLYFYSYDKGEPFNRLLWGGTGKARYAYKHNVGAVYEDGRKAPLEIEMITYAEGAPMLQMAIFYQ